MGIIMQSGDNSPSEQQSPFGVSAQSPQSAASPQFSGTVNDPAQYVVTSGYDASEKKEGMSWGQYAKGLFTPFAILLLLSIYSDASGGGGIMSDSFFYLMILIGIVAIVISFARGNKSYGYVLITAVSIPLLWIVFIYGFVILLMIGFV